MGLNLGLPETTQALILIVVFFMPGFIASRVFTLCFPGRPAPEKVQLLSSITLSFFNYAFWSWAIWILLYTGYWQTHPIQFACLVVVIVLASPIVLGIGLAVATEKKWFVRFVKHFGVQAPPYPEAAWDTFFRKNPKERWWVIIRLRDGIIVRGFYGWNSHAGSTPDCRDIYLERECDLNENGTFKIIEQSGGVYLGADSFDAIVLRKVKEATKNA